MVNGIQSDVAEQMSSPRRSRTLALLALVNGAARAAEARERKVIALVNRDPAILNVFNECNKY